MASILASRYNKEETLSATSIVNEEITGKHLSDPLFQLLSTILRKGETDLRTSFAYHDTDSLAKESDEIDTQFNMKWQIFCDVSDSMEKAASLGGKWESAGVVKAVIDSHDRNLHRKSKDVQISLFDNVSSELNIGSDESPVVKAGLAPLFNQLIPLNQKLKDIEKARAEVARSSKEVPAPYVVAKELTPALIKLHDHLETLVEYGAEEYAETLNSINSRLEPIVTRVKARKTKSENSSEA